MVSMLSENSDVRILSVQIVESYCCGVSQAGELQESADTDGESGSGHVYLMKSPHEHS